MAALLQDADLFDLAILVAYLAVKVSCILV